MHLSSTKLELIESASSLTTISLASMETFSQCQRPLCPVKKKKNKYKN